ncbi:hypothetical protein JC2156_09740 [Weissella koreensis KCTC 3621]|nr:hypothetical protein JC2156_09740 [Weissella koreensis KCTC 3621]
MNDDAFANNKNYVYNDFKLNKFFGAGCNSRPTVNDFYIKVREPF